MVVAGIDIYANNAATTLTADIVTTPAAGTSESWLVASSATPLPQAVSGGMSWRAAISGPSGDPDPELVQVVGHPDGIHVQVLRGLEGSTIKTHSSGDTLRAVLTAEAVRGGVQYVAMTLVVAGFYQVETLIPLPPAINAGDDLCGSLAIGIPATVLAAGNAGQLSLFAPRLPADRVLTYGSATLFVSNAVGTEKLVLEYTSSTVLASHGGATVNFGAATVLETVGSDLSWDSGNLWVTTAAGGQFFVSALCYLSFV